MVYEVNIYTNFAFNFVIKDNNLLLQQSTFYQRLRVRQIVCIGLTVGILNLKSFVLVALYCIVPIYHDYFPHPPGSASTTPVTAALKFKFLNCLITSSHCS